jgi:hypothetical protein
VATSSIGSDIYNIGGQGGGIFNDGPVSTVTLTNSTVSGNSVNGGDINDPPQGGGIWNTSPPMGEDPRPLALINSIVANQVSGGDCQGSVVVSLGYNLDSDGSCGLIATGDLPNTNPMLDLLVLNPPGSTQTQALQIGSPAIDHIPSGVNGCGTTIPTDQRGVSRPQGVGCDIGAYELVPAPPTPSPAPVGGIVALPVSGSDSGTGSAALPIALVGAAALAAMFSGWYVTRRWLR